MSDVQDDPPIQDEGHPLQQTSTWFSGTSAKVELLSKNDQWKCARLRRTKIQFQVKEKSIHSYCDKEQGGKKREREREDNGFCFWGEAISSVLCWLCFLRWSQNSRSSSLYILPDFALLLSHPSTLSRQSLSLDRYLSCYDCWCLWLLELWFQQGT